MKQDVRFAFRLLIKNPAFTLVAIAALALGIGANTAIFSVIDAVLLAPLAYSHPERLVMIWQHIGTPPLPGRLGGSVPDYVDYRNQSQTMQPVAAFTLGSFNLTGRGAPERINGARVTANLFPTLGIAPILGRTFSVEEDQPGRDREIVLSYAAWQRRFGSDPNVLGSAVILDQVPYTVIGIMPRGFDFPPQGFGPPDPSEFWRPIAFTSRQLAERGDSFGTYMIGRLKPGVTMARANADLQTIAARITASYPPQFRDRLRTAASLDDLHDVITGRIRTGLLVILGAVGFVLLIACANIANLLLARAAAREREIAVRAAIGASRWRILRQLLTESVLLASISGAAGIAVAVWTTDLLLRYSPANIPRLGAASLDWRVLGFALALSLATGLLFGAVPALHATRMHFGARGASTTLRQSKLRGALVTSEIAIALTLLIGAGLLLRSFLNLRSAPIGFRPDHILTAGITLPEKQYATEAQIKTFYSELIGRVQALPGVEAAALATSVPFIGDWTIAITPEGEPSTIKEAFKTADFHGVTPGYHRTLGIELTRGRFFTPDDRAGTQPVAIVSETMARRYWPGQDALGKQFKWGPAQSSRPWLRIVGIVSDVKQSSLDEKNRPTAYLPYTQMPANSTEHSGRSIFLAVRTTSEPSSLAADLRRVVNTMDSGLPVFAVRPMGSVLAATVAPRRFNMLLVAAFAALALLLACLGLYGVMSYTVNQYTHEIGIRLALGARSADVVRMILLEGMTLALAGIAIGAAAALALTRLMRSLLFEIQPADPITFLSVSVLLAAVALLATYIPARRATRVDPLIALRTE